MDKIVEEALTNMIRRIEVLEAKVEGKPEIKSQKKGYKSGTATPGQIKYLGILGGETFEGMTKAEAGKEIDRLIKLKEKNEANQETPNQDVDPKSDEKEEPFVEQESKPLTEEEIKEIGEDALL